MRRILVALGLFACSSSVPLTSGPVCDAVPATLALAPPPRSVGLAFDPWDQRRPELPAQPAAQVAAVPMPPVVSLGDLVRVYDPPPTMQTGAPSSSLTRVAVTDNGRAAISMDFFGGLRLWPTLDGHREPLVVTARTATTHISIEHAIDPVTQLIVARLDDAGTVEVLRFSEDGALLGRNQLHHDRAFVSVQALRDGVIAMRDDGVVVRIGRDGLVERTLLPAPGERVASLLYRRGRVLALMSSAKGVVGQWVEAPLSWGARTPTLAIRPDTAVLSPDHTKLAAIGKVSGAFVTVALATGKSVTISEPGFENRMIGFTDPDVLAIVFDGQLRWWRNKHLSEPTTSMFSQQVVVGDGRVVAPSGFQLGIETLEGVRFVGYRLATPTRVRVVPGGMLLTGDRTLIRVDDSFQERARYQLAPELFDIIPLDRRHVVGTVQRAQAYFVDLEEPKNTRLLGPGNTIEYEPSTGLLAIVNGQDVRFAYFDPTTGVLGELTELAPPNPDGAQWATVALFDPAVTQGKVAAVFEHLDFGQQPDMPVDMLEIRKVHKTGSARIVAGRRRQISAQRHSEITTRTPRRRASADGAHIVELARSRVTLRDATTRALWSVPAPDVTDVGWTSGGELLVVGGGTAILDVTNGDIVRRRCGWEFGLWTEPTFDQSTGQRSLCEGTLE